MDARARARRSIDHVADGETAAVNAHLRRFFERHANGLVKKLREDDNYSSWARVKSKALKKELTEAVGACEIIERELERVGTSMVEEAVGDVRVFDVCCGKGMTSCVAAASIVNCDVIAVDRDKRMNMKHLASEQKITFKEMDAYDEAVDEMMRDAKLSGKVVVVCGVHLCGDLSRRAIELFARWGDILVLSPCCLVREVRAWKRPCGEFGYGLARAARRLEADSHDLWCKLLLAHVPTHLGSEFAPVSKRIVVDDALLSEKNRFIVARRERPRSACVSCDGEEFSWKVTNK
ncbi:hypothetical protein BE221DRAFT_144382 [Ostreococcus tauri]|uniref:Methyltransferase domain-containing protein n=1 Tax=Ostreococcus tauri TaxID=70448 RepID=A0A1Y5IKX2_OSTTA|nr:hypothetical protein BE221DRAFT_144382 [Ostreococcus tauri]